LVCVVYQSEIKDFTSHQYSLLNPSLDLTTVPLAVTCLLFSTRRGDEEIIFPQLSPFGALLLGVVEEDIISLLTIHWWRR